METKYFSSVGQSLSGKLMKICTQMALLPSPICRYRSLLHEFASCRNCVAIHLKLMSTKSSREMTKCILSLLLKVFTSQQFAIPADEKLCSSRRILTIVRAGVAKIP